MRTAIRNLFLFLTMATMSVSTASVDAQSQRDDSAPRSRYRLVETVRKVSVSQERYSRATEITRPTKRSAEPAFVPRSQKQVAPIQYPTSYSGPLGGTAVPVEGQNVASKTSVASIPSFDSATRPAQSATGLASYNLVPDPAVEPVEPMPSRPQFEEAAPQPIQGPGVVTPLPGGVAQPPLFVEGQAISHPTAVQLSQPVYNQPLNFQSENYSSYAPEMSYSVFGVHEDECCDEWAGFCDCKPMDIPCACGGLKFNPGHFGRSWLKSKTDVCQDGGSSCLGKSNCGCGRKSRGCGKSSCDSGCNSGSCSSSDCGCDAATRQLGTIAPRVTHKIGASKCTKTGGLFSKPGFFTGTKSACNCNECQSSAQPASSCGCDSCK